ncbi:MAG: hypothetical protein ACLVCH_16535 [Roseburia inulinivorans]
MKSLSATAPHFNMWLQTVPISPVSQKNWNCRNLWKPRLHPVMYIGRAVYKLGDRELGTVDILCSEDIAAAVYKDYFMESLQMYLP